MNVIKLDEEAIYHVAHSIAPGEAREAYLGQVCGDDATLRYRIEALLRVCEQEASFLEFSPYDATVDMPTPIERPGTIIGPYKLMEQIGEGGMGVVYVAEQTKPVRRKVALKIIKPGMDTRQVVARFEAERQALAMMDHPNIAKVHDGGATDSGRPYFVMELVRGLPITEYCDGEQFSIRERLELFVLICRAVQHAHQKGVIHRDLKPSNILVTLHDGVPVPKVIDFGVAKATGQSLTDKTIYTAFTQLVGTPLYMSPEQVELSGLDIDTRSDIYSLGVLLYELLTGTTPFDSETLRQAAFDEMRRIIREEEPPKPSTRLSTLGETLTTVSVRRKADPRRLGHSMRGELDWVVMRALEKDRRRRYETANDFASDVMRFLSDQPVEACPPSAGYRLRKLVRRNKGPVAAGLALAAVLVLGMVGTSIGLVWALQAERKATEEKGRAIAAENKAKQAETNAKEEAAVANAVRDFLTDDLLAQASPDTNPRAKKVTVEELLGRAADRIAGKFAQQPRVEAEIRMTIGGAYLGLGNYTAAEPHLERALEIGSRVLGDEHPRTFSFMGELGAMYTMQGKRDQAEPLLVRALEGERRVRGEEDGETLTTMRSLGMMYMEQGKHAQAEPLLVRALDVGRRVRGEEDGGTLLTMSNLGAMYTMQGKHAQAEPLLVRALEVGRRVRGEEDGYTIDSMYVLADLYWRKRQYREAEALLVQELEVGRRVLGEEHHKTLFAMNNLGMIYKAQRKLEQAEPLFVRALEIRRRIHGETHPEVFNTAGNLAVLYLDQGKLDQAEPILVRALEVGRPVLGESHPQMLRAASNLATVYEFNMRFERSTPLYEDVLKRTRDTLGPDHPDTLRAMAQLGFSYQDAGRWPEGTELLEQAWAKARTQPDPLVNVLAWIPRALGDAYEKAGRFPKAESLYRETLEMDRQRHKEASSDSIALQVSLARSLLKQQRYAEAEPLLREGLKFREQYETNDWMTSDTKSLLGEGLLGQVKYAEAERLLSPGYEGMKQREGKIPLRVRKSRLTEAIERLVRLYEAWGQPEKAAEWRAKLPPAAAKLPDDVFARP